jgi:MoaA/NifB/PqqE/SkfB family radical SAM enzyme
MPRPDLHESTICNEQVAQCLETGNTAQAVQLASVQTSQALSELGVAQVAGGQIKEGLDTLQKAVQIAPQNEGAFRNLVSSLLRTGMLKDANLNNLANFLARHYHDLPWAPSYAQLMVAPCRLNIQLVGGKCNLKCRMCRGTRSGSYPDKLTYLEPEVFARMLESSPTVSGVTFSAGDSDPLLHPHLDQIINTAAAHRVVFDLFTNGHALSARLCRQIVESQSVAGINFSIDAATPETYQRIRGASFDRVVAKMRMFSEMRASKGSRLPNLSLSFVGMADNIEELPAFVDLAEGLGAYRVYLENLQGWPEDDAENRPAQENPKWAEAIREAHRRTVGTQVMLEVAGPLRTALDHGQQDDAACSMQDSAVEGATELEGISKSGETQVVDPAAMTMAEIEQAKEQSQQSTLGYCPWLHGAWVHDDGSLHPCCLVTHAVDLGNLTAGPVFDNEPYVQFKLKLADGAILPQCMKVKGCPYVDQLRTSGQRIQFIESDAAEKRSLEDQDQAAAAQVCG